MNTSKNNIKLFCLLIYIFLITGCSESVVNQPQNISQKKNVKLLTAPEPGKVYKIGIA